MHSLSAYLSQPGQDAGGRAKKRRQSRANYVLTAKAGIHSAGTECKNDMREGKERVGGGTLESS